ncbi:MAG: protein kinase [Chloroflexota bacterium]
MSLSPGQILHQRYRIVSLLGQGGFGAVYRAWDLNLEQPCAVKENLDTSPEALRQFKREAQILARLSHPNLPRVVDHFILPGSGTGSGSAYLVMEYIDGEDLQSMLNGRPGPLPLRQVVRWMAQICDALTFLHAQNPPVIHRDIKPANIKITSQGKVMLVDFGIAKLYDPQAGTTVGARAVTPGYSPLEQYGLGKTDARSDVYALGATVYTLLSGLIPPASVDISAGNTPPPIPIHQINPAVSPGVSALIEQAMQLKRDERLESAAQFKAGLLAGGPTQVLTGTKQSLLNNAAQTGQRSNQRRTWALAAGLLALVLLVTGMLGGVLVRKLVEGDNPFATPSLASSIGLPMITSSVTSPEMTATPGPTASPTPEGPRLAGTPLPEIRQPITPENIGQVREVAQWGAGAASDLDWSLAGDLLALALPPGVRLFKANTLEEIRTISSPSMVTTLAFAPDGSMLATGSQDGRLRLWRVADGSLLQTLEGHNDPVVQVIFAPNGTMLASTSKDFTIRLWLVSDGSMLRVISGHESTVLDLSFSPDSARLASASYDGTARLWSVEDGAQLRTLVNTLQGIYRPPVSSIAFSPNGEWIAANDGSATINILQTSDGSLLAGLDGAAGYDLEYSPDGSFIATCTREGGVQLWQAVATSNRRRDLGAAQGVVKRLRFSPDGTRLATIGEDSWVRTWNVASGEMLQQWRGSSRLLGLAFSASGKQMLSVSDDSQVHLWNSADGSLASTWQGSFRMMPGVNLSPDGSWIYSALEPVLWRSNGERVPINIPEGTMPVTFSADGQLLAYSDGEYVNVLRITDNSIVNQFQVGDYPGNLAFSTDGSQLAGLFMENARIWGLSQGKLEHTLPVTFPQSVYILLFIPGRQTLAAIEGENIEFFEALDGQDAGYFTGHNGQILGMSFSPDGKLMATVSDEDGVMIWHVEHRSHLRTFAVPGAGFPVFSPDGRFLAYASPEGVIHLLGIP